MLHARLEREKEEGVKLRDAWQGVEAEAGDLRERLNELELIAESCKGDKMTMVMMAWCLWLLGVCQCERVTTTMM